MFDLNLELEKALQSPDPDMAYSYAIYHLSKIPSEHRAKVLNRLEEAVIKFGNAKYAYLFAIDIEGANMKALEDVVIKSSDTHYAFMFALFIKGASIDVLEEVVIKSGDPMHAYLFARGIKGANIKALEPIIQKDDFYWYVYKNTR